MTSASEARALRAAYLAEKRMREIARRDARLRRLSFRIVAYRGGHAS